MLDKCGSLAVLVSFLTTRPLSVSAMYKSVENRPRDDRNAIHRPSGLSAGPMFRSAPRLSVSSSGRPAWMSGVAAASTGAYSERIEACHSLDSVCELTSSTSTIAASTLPVAAATINKRGITASP